MRRILFVSNGHGETAIAGRIAEAVRTATAEPLGLDHLPLVGTGVGSAPLATVGPQRAMPSGGLVAMGNVRAFVADVRAGFASLLLAQLAFLRHEGRLYDAAVAVGDVYALALTLVAARAPLFVGTAKSVYVAPYGWFERWLLRRASRVFVRDAATAAALRVQRVRAEAPGNVIVDLLDEAGPSPPAGSWIGLLPGSRGTAYRDAVRLAQIVRSLGERRAGAEALMSIAPTVDAGVVARGLAEDGWAVSVGSAPTVFAATSGATRLIGWGSALGPMLRACRLVVGQAGTANEQAAACGVPVVALAGDQGEDWYRMRQRRLLGEALVLVPSDPEGAAAALERLLADDGALARMRCAGPQRLGPRGGAAAIAGAVLDRAIARPGEVYA